MTFGDVWEFLSEHKEHKVLRSRITLGDILNDMLKCHQEVIDAKLTIAALTARAEQAEAREKAALEDMKDYCQFCRYCDEEDDEEPCNECENVTHDERESKWTWRGLPQEGEGK